MLHSYPSLFNLGHKAIQFLLDVPVIVEEKIDGSQISFGVGTDGELRIRSRGAQIYLDAPNAMFAKAVEVIRPLASRLTPGSTFRGEYLAKPKHNTLAYNRTPKNYIIIFDIERTHGDFLGPVEKAATAEALGFETVPHLFQGKVNSADELRAFLERESILGGQKIEGVVIKPASYDLYGTDKHVLMGKFVSEAFKEIHGGEWRKSNPTSGDVLQEIIAKFTTPSRWNKAVQHLKEAGQLEDSPRDIGKLIKEVPMDVLKECREEIAAELWAAFWPKIQRGLTAGLPQWYKEELLKLQFEREEKPNADAA